jgi:hypothetical protein
MLRFLTLLKNQHAVQIMFPPLIFYTGHGSIGHN